LPNQCYYFKTNITIFEEYFSDWAQIFQATPRDSVIYEKDHIRATFIPIANCVLTEDKNTIFGLVKKVIKTNPKTEYESGEF